MSKLSPGPWRWDDTGPFLRDGNGGYVVATSNPADVEVGDADACAIAAVPELVELLGEAASLLEPARAPAEFGTDATPARWLDWEDRRARLRLLIPALLAHISGSRP